MAINKDSNTYTISFAIILVIIVGGLLAAIANGLKPIQDENLVNEKKQNILNCLPGNKSITRDEAGSVFANFVKQRVILNYNGEIKENTLLDNSTELNNKDSRDAFSVDLLKEYKTIKDEKSRNYPLFICDVEGKTYYVAPVMGKGLWAAVWGFIAIDESGNSISGTVFDHKSETPGLGAEISQDFFEDQFIGKLISNEEIYKSVEVNKPGNPLNDYQVDGISGGTFTSVGVEEMMSRTLVVYHKYIKNLNRS
jgi:Na+-transporting NADH:ubiquinone oxidoreductase subunit C